MRCGAACGHGLRTRFADTAKHADAFFVIRAISSYRNRKSSGASEQRHCAHHCILNDKKYHAGLRTSFGVRGLDSNRLAIEFSFNHY